MVVLSSCCKMFGSVLQRTQSSGRVYKSRPTRYDKYWEAKIMTNIHDPYGLGLTRVTMIRIITGILVIFSES